MEHAHKRPRRAATKEGSRPVYGIPVQGGRGRYNKAGEWEGIGRVSSHDDDDDRGLEGRSARVAQGLDCYCADLGYRHGHISSCSSRTGGEARMSKIKTTLIIVAIVFSIGASTAAGILAVVSGVKRTEANCRAVQGVRDDLVTALKRIEKRALEQAKTPQQEARIREAYESKKKGEEGLITQIGDPACP